MPRKGWQSVDVPSGWVQIIRGPRPEAATWPRRGETPQPAQRRQSNVPFPRQEPVDPDTALASARLLVTKLERAMEVVGESDPIYPGLVGALKRARTQAQVRPVADRISATESFIERARKRVEKERKEVEKVKAELAKAEAQLVLEEESLRGGENRLLVLRQEANGEDQSPPATVPVDFVSRIGAVEDNGARSVAGARAVEVRAGRAGFHAARGGSSQEGEVVSFSLSRFDVNLEPRRHWGIVETHQG